MGELTGFTEIHDPSNVTQLPALNEEGTALRWSAHGIRRHLLRTPMDAQYRPMFPFISVGTQVRATNSIHFTPFYANVDFQLDALIMSTAQALSNATARAGIFAYNAETNAIGDLENDFGEDDISAGGAGEWTALSYGVAKGWHALAYGIRGNNPNTRMINYLPDVKPVVHNGLTGTSGAFNTLSYFETTGATDLDTGFTNTHGSSATEVTAATGYQTSPFFWKISYPELEVAAPR